MPNAQADIDALLAEASELASEGGTSGASAPVSAPAAPEPEPPADPRPADPRPAPTSRRSPPSAVQRVLHVEVPVIVKLAERKMPVDTIMALAPGLIIEFEKTADSELELMVNNESIAHGQAVKVGENFGLRITTIGTMQEKIQAMGN